MTKYLWIIQVLQILLDWYDKAKSDKVVTDDEIADLLTRVAKVTNFRIKV